MCAAALPLRAAQPGTMIPVHDPVVIQQSNTFYIFATGQGIAVWSSTNLQEWKREQPVFSKPPEWAVNAVPGFRGHIWAPDISHYRGRYYLFYSVSAFGKNTSCIGVATNATLNPSDPRFRWDDQGKVIQSSPGVDNWNAIDPNVAVDHDGTAYLAFGSFWGGLKIARLTPDRLHIDEDIRALKTIASRVTPKATKQKEGEDESAPVTAGANAIEAPFVFEHRGYFYLFASIDYCCRGIRSDYKMIVGRAESVKGRYVDKTGMPMVHGGGTLVLAGNADWPGVGHNAACTIRGDDYLVFHAYDASDRGRSKLRIEKIKWSADGWPSVTSSGDGSGSGSP